MNSSGIKRGLATTAVSALAVAGIPFIASSASAAAGDSITVASVGPIRNAGALGGEVLLKTKGVDEANLKLKGTNLTSGPNSPSQTVSIVSRSIVLDGANGDSNKTDGLDEITLNLAVTTPSAGDSFAVAVYEDEAGGTADTVDAGEARATISGATAGAPASIAISPDSQTTSAGVPTGNYTAAIADSAGNATQLTTGEGFALAGTGVTFTPDNTLDPADLVSGSTTFKASSNTSGETTFTATGNGTGGTPATVTDSAVINVIANATIDADEFDLVTGADEFEAGDAFGGTYQVRVDQGSVTFEFMSKDGGDADTIPDDANKAVVLTLSSGTLKFGGAASKSYTVVLDADGKGSLTVSPSGIVAGSQMTFESASSGIASTTLEFARAAADSVKAGQAVYVTKVGSPTEVTVSVLDQFGDPIGAPAQVSIVRGLRNGSTQTARQTVGSDGKATFTLPDAGTTVGSETFTINLFEDQFDGTPSNFAGARIDYTADGLGGNFTIAGASDDATATKVFPLYDGVANSAGSEFETISVALGTPDAPATFSVDNGALIVGSDNTLAKAVESKTITLSNTGTGSVNVIGTKTGVVTVTITSAGRTKTVKYTVEQPTGAALEASARNVELDGPEGVVAGDVATYTATVTDAFGNPVPTVDDSNVVFQVSGPASLQNKEGATDANGEIEQTVLLTDSANGSITVSVRGENSGNVTQFGKAANSYAAANDAPGLSASKNTDSVTSTVTNIEALEQAVEDAEIALAEAEADLASAQAELDVAQAELAIAQANVDTLTAKKQKLRKKLNRAKANDNKQKAKTTRKKLRQTKRALRAAKDDVTLAQAKVDARTTVVTLRQTQVDKAQADLDEAQANLDEAQN
jgi:hypothetical protein